MTSPESALLLSLDQTGAIPVDTHVWEIACRDLDPTLKACGSLTPAVYERVGELFRTKYGAHAGWAHSLLFAAELPQYRSALPETLQVRSRDACMHARTHAGGPVPLGTAPRR